VVHRKTFISILERQTLEQPCGGQGCGNMATLSCPKCSGAWYCNMACMIRDEENHEMYCCLMSN
jgi:hypothetical protein